MDEARAKTLSDDSVVVALAALEQRVTDLTTSLRDIIEASELSSKTALDTAKDALDTRLRSGDEQLLIHIDAQKESVNTALLALDKLLAEKDKATDVQEARQREALSKSEAALSVRLNAMNEFRSQITAERATYLTREVGEQMISRNIGRLDQLEKWQAKIIGALMLVTFFLPAVTGIIVYLLTRHGITVTPSK